MHPDSITDWLNKFSEENDLPHIHPHAFRHTAASMMIANGVDLVNAAAELGHATASTTLNLYAHQVARARAEASGIRAGAFAVLGRHDNRPHEILQVSCGRIFLFSDWCAGNGCSETRHPSVSVSPYPDHGIAHFSLIAEAKIE